MNITKHPSVKIIEPVNLYGCTLLENVFIGPFVEIQNDVFIDYNTRIQSHTFICSKTTIGKDCFIGHGVMFTNDKFTVLPISRDRLLPTKIGDRVLIGTNSTILPVEICDDVIIGAGSVVTKNITTPGVYAGNPARKLK